MKRALRSVLLVLLLSVVGMGKMYAQSFTVGDLNYQVNNDGVSVTVTGHVDGQNATGSLVIPETVEYNGLNYSVTAIGDWAFFGCSGFTGNLTIPNSVTIIGSDAFGNCSGFNGKLTVGNSVTVIGGWAFADCSGFTGSLTIPNSVITVGEGAFFVCSGFTGGLIIGDSVTEIGDYAFDSCDGFSLITNLSETPPTLGDEVFWEWDSNISVCVPCGFEEAYVSLFWGGFGNFVGMCGGTVTVIASPDEGGTVTGGGTFEAGQSCTVTATINEGYLFANWTQNGILGSSETEYTFYVAGDMVLVAHFVPDGNIVFSDDNVKSICLAHWDTNGDDELSYLEAASVTELSNYFRNNSEITSFEELQYFIGLTTISSGAFYECNNLSGSLLIPNSVRAIGDFAFCRCSALSGSLNIPNSVSTIGNAAFSECSGFTGSLTIGNSVTSIGDLAFAGCSGFTGSLTLGNSVTTIGTSAFGSCSGFTGSLTIPNSVTTIGRSAFRGCSGLTGSLTIGNSVTAIDESAFWNCSGLTGSLTIGNSVTMIGNDAFFNCYRLRAIVSLADMPPTLGNGVFDNVPITIPVYVPCHAVEDYQAANCWSNFTNIAEECSVEVSVMVNPFEGGTTTGAGIYIGGDICVLSATSSPGYIFGNWTENGRIVSMDPVYSFHAYPTTIVANFYPETITFADENVKLLCVANWDTNGDGELSYAEASVVSDLGEVFKNNSTITSFDELHCFLGLATIGDEAFYNCSSLNSIIIPNSVTRIGNKAFYGCERLSSIFIPGSVENIVFNPFEACSGLEHIVVESGNLFYDSRENCNAVIITNSSTMVSGCKNTIIPNSVTTIGNHAFYGCSDYTGSLIIPNSVTVIGD